MNTRLLAFMLVAPHVATAQWGRKTVTKYIQVTKYIGREKTVVKTVTSVSSMTKSTTIVSVVHTCPPSGVGIMSTSTILPLVSSPPPPPSPTSSSQPPSFFSSQPPTSSSQPPTSSPAPATTSASPSSSLLPSSSPMPVSVENSRCGAINGTVYGWCPVNEMCYGPDAHWPGRCVPHFESSTQTPPFSCRPTELQCGQKGWAVGVPYGSISVTGDFQCSGWCDNNKVCKSLIPEKPTTSVDPYVYKCLDPDPPVPQSLPAEVLATKCGGIIKGWCPVNQVCILKGENYGPWYCASTDKKCGTGDGWCPDQQACNCSGSGCQCGAPNPPKCGNPSLGTCAPGMECQHPQRGRPWECRFVL